MRTLFLIAPSSRNGQTDFRSDRDVEMTGSSLVGTVLARRYKILERIEVGTFKAQDLALDQTVTVRQALLTSQRTADTWRQKVQQLALVRDANFLNVLDVIFDKSSDFVITERPRGRPLADLLRERSRLDPEDVLRLVTPIAGALDLAAAFSCCPNPISTCWLFTETSSSCAVDPEQGSLSDWPPFLVKLDVWELVRPRKNNAWPFLPSKAQTGGSRGWAIRQGALLTYELLGGDKKKDGEVKRHFKPVSGLGTAGNSILYRGLQGSPLFESSGCFFHKLKSAIQSGDGTSRALPAPELATQMNSLALPGTSDMIRRFNRDTWWLATGVLGAVVFAALVLAVQERDPRKPNPAKSGVQAGSDLLLNDNPAARSTIVGLNGMSSTDKTTSGQASSVDHALTKIFPRENPSSEMAATASTPTPVFAFRKDVERVKESKVPRAISRPSIRPRIVDVKRQLIALWHKSLMRSERTRNWTRLANPNKGDRKKVSYTAETNH